MYLTLLEILDVDDCVEGDVDFIIVGSFDVFVDGEEDDDCSFRCRDCCFCCGGCCSWGNDCCFICASFFSNATIFASVLLW